nr:MAG: major capsid protein [Microvirus sp.]
MSQIFDKIQLKSPINNVFDLSHDHKTTFNMGELIPFHVQEVLPGDRFKIHSQNLLRFSPLVSPALARIKAFTTYFFVPNRILWDGWEEFITGGQDPSNTPAVPLLYDPVAVDQAITVQKGDLLDYMGLPKGIPLKSTFGTPVSALPMAAYQRIWYDYYRDQNLQDIAWVPLQNGEFNATLNYGVLRKRAWQRDYLTSCLPFAQKGDAVTIPIAGDITGQGIVERDPTALGPLLQHSLEAGTPLSNGVLLNKTGDILEINGVKASIDPNGTLFVDGDSFELSSISTTINDLRTANALQRWLEKNARSGSRYIESLKAHFHTSPTDARLQRPEMIGSSIQSVIISEILQTSETADTPQGNMAGHGISASKNGYFNYTAQEHGIIIGLISVVPDASYAQGLSRMFTRLTRLDYAFPDFANLGEQAVLKREVVAKTTEAFNTATFGYMPRYAEYKFNNSLTTGEFAPDQSLEYWTLTRKFDTSLAEPLELNEDFIVADPSTRIFAVTDPNEHKIMAHIYSDIKCRRPLPKYGTPLL